MHVDKQRHCKEVRRTAGAEPAIAKLSMYQCSATFPLRSTDPAVVQKALRELFRVQKAVRAAPMKQIGVVENRNERIKTNFDSPLRESHLGVGRARPMHAKDKRGRTSPFGGPGNRRSH